MVSIKLKLRKSKNEGVACGLYYQVNCMRRTRQVTTSFKIFQNEWNPELENVVITNGNSSRMNYLYGVRSCIEYDKKCFKRIINKLLLSDSFLSVDKIVEEFQYKPKGITLFSYMQNVIDRLWRQGQYRTSETYKTTLSSFKKFRKEEDVYLEDINSELLVSYEYHLKAQGLCLNTISFYMKRLRAIYNNAVEDGLIDDGNPFKKVYTSSEKTIKRAISLENIRKLKDMDLRNSTSKSFSRDMFLFSFYTRGMSFVDIAYLQKKNLCDNILMYRRKKTGQLLSIRWEPCMQNIVNRYSSQDSPYLLSILKIEGNDRKQYHNALVLINRNLKEIGKELGLTLPLTMYVARHSWASIAKNEGIPLSIISEGMGHDSESTTQIYLASLDTEVINNANRKILELL